VKPSVPARALRSGARRTESFAAEILRGCVAEKHRRFNPIQLGQKDGSRAIGRSRQRRCPAKVLCG
jgi:hypothetical protein